jgi:predicted Zn finger-like uncharacterized protein
VSLIIECPACATRYKLNKPVPEGGRSVKCARCAHQWRLVPEDAAEEVVAQEETSVPQQEAPAEHHEIFARRTTEAETPDERPEAGWDEASDPEVSEPVAAQDEPSAAPAWRNPFLRNRAGADEDEPAPSSVQDSLSALRGWSATQNPPLADEGGEEDDLPRISSWRSEREQFATSISTLSEPSAEDYGVSGEPTANAVGETNWADEEAGQDEAENWPKDARDAGLEVDERIEIFGGADARFQTLNRTDADDDDQPQADAPASENTGGSWASRLMRLRQSPFGRRQQEQPDDAAAAIRQALNSALEQPDDGGAAKSHFRKLSPERFGGLTDQESAPEGGAGRFTRFGGSLDQDRREGELAEPRQSPFAFAGRARIEPEDDQDENEPSFRLNTQSARTPIFGGARDLDEEAEREAGQFGADRLQTDFEGAFGTADDAAKEAGAFEGSEDFGNLYDSHFERENSERDPRDVLNEDLAALQMELEGTDVATYDRGHPQKSGGGFAVVAAWAVFISVISGVMLALITFRQEIMTALPGTANLYQGLGFQVNHAGIDFADVSYRWRTADGKPMIEVTGQVVNLTSHTVTVPRVLVNVRDAGGSDSVKATANVPARELAPRGRASFSLEFLSPPADVAQIELEFDRNR